MELPAGWICFPAEGSQGPSAVLRDAFQSSNDSQKPDLQPYRLLSMLMHFDRSGAVCGTIAIRNSVGFATPTDAPFQAFHFAVREASKAPRLHRRCERLPQLLPL